MRQLLTETYARTKKTTGVNPQTPSGFRQTLADPNAFRVYARSLAEGLNDVDRSAFLKMAATTRVSLMENSMFQLNPYETLTMPILRYFMPKLIAKELVNVMPIDKPEVLKGFIKPKFKKYNADATGLVESDWDYNYPSIDTDISRGPKGAGAQGVTTVNAYVDTSNVTAYDILGALGVTPATTPAHIEKDLRITSIEDSSGNETVLSDPIICTVDGNISANVTHDNGDTDIIVGGVDFLNGTIVLKSVNGNTTRAYFTAYVSLEENSINPEVKFDIEKIRLTVVDRRISSSWTVNMEQDIKALYDIQLQSELVNLIGEQIALDIDREIITDLITANSTKNDASHTETFNRYPTSTYTWGQKNWMENIVPVLNNLSAVIYNATRMQGANTLACNPVDAAIFESLNGFEYVGDATAGGEVGYRSATVASGKFKVLVSSIVPANSILMKYRSDDITRAAYIYAPYVPALLIPYPLGPNPTLSIMSRYATKVIRPEALGVVTITNDLS